MKYLIALFAALVFCGAVTAAEEKVIHDKYYVLELDGSKAGAVRNTVVQIGNIIRYTDSQKMKLRRAGISVETEVKLNCRETTTGQLISFEHINKSSMQSVTTKGVLVNGKLELTASTMGKKRKEVLDWHEGAVMGYALEKKIKQYLKSGKKHFSVETFMLDRIAFVTLNITVIGDEKINVPGKGEVLATHLKMDGAMPGITMHEWRDVNLETVFGSVDMLGIKMEVYEVSKEEAIIAEAGGADLLLDLAIKTEIRPATPRRVKSILYTIDISKTEFDANAFNGVGQTVEGVTKDGIVKLRVESIFGDAKMAEEADYTAPEVTKYLVSSTYAQSDDPVIIKQTKDIIGDRKNKFEIAKLLEKWISINLINKGYDRGFASAKETLQDRAGDCTEHSVLLVAMLRAAGIPARGATGLVCVELSPGKLIFGYHMWTEVYLGEWVPLDAAVFAGTFVDATHIKLATDELIGISSSKSMVEIVQLIGNMDIKIHEITSVDRNRRRDFQKSKIAGNTVELDNATMELPYPWKQMPVAKNAKNVMVAVAKSGKHPKTYLMVQDVKPTTTNYDVLCKIGSRNKFYHITPTEFAGKSGFYVHYGSYRGQYEVIFALHNNQLLVLKAQYNRIRELQALASCVQFSWED